MRPPICAVCGDVFDPEKEALVTFRHSPEDGEWYERPTLCLLDYTDGTQLDAIPGLRWPTGSSHFPGLLRQWIDRGPAALHRQKNRPFEDHT